MEGEGRGCEGTGKRGAEVWNARYDKDAREGR